LLLGFIFLTGCNQEYRAPVSGKVTMEGKLLKDSGLVISFIGKDGLPVTAEIGQDGTYKASGVLVGEVTVLIAWNAPAEKSPAQTTKPTGADLKEPPPPEKEAPPAPKSPIPEKYSDPAKSPLKTVIAREGNTYDVDLKK
jgi:hypothetical protein